MKKAINTAIANYFLTGSRAIQQSKEKDAHILEITHTYGVLRDCFKAHTILQPLRV